MKQITSEARIAKIKYWKYSSFMEKNSYDVSMSLNNNL